MLLEVITGLAVIGGALYLWLTWNYNYWAKRGILQLEPSLFFGNLKDMVFMTNNVGVIYDKLYWKHPEEPAFGIYRLRQPQFLVRDAQLVKTMLVKEFSSFHDNDIELDPQADPVFGNNPFVVKGDKWKAARSVTTPALTVAKIKNMVDHMKIVCKDMISYIQESGDKYLEAKILGGQYTSDVVTGCVYGIVNNSFKNPDSIYRKNMLRTFQADFWTNLSFILITIAPKLVKIFKLRFLPKDVADFFTQVVTDTVKFRKENSYRRDDYLQQLIDQSGQNGQKPYTMEEIMSHSLTFVVDGYETSSLLIAHLLDLVSLHPEVQEKLRNEIKEKIKSIDDITFESLHSLPYLEAVISEALRLRPPGTVLTKLCTKDITIPFEGRTYTLDKGTSVAIPLMSIQKDPKYFDDPESFKPERFLEGEANPLGYFPFGMGPRACLGSRFALTQVKACICSLISNFEVVPRDFGKREFDGNSALLLYIKGGVWLKFKPLQH